MKNNSHTNQRLGYEASNVPRTGQIDDALRLYEEICRKDPDNPAGWLGMAVIHAQLNRFDQAEEYLNRAINLRDDLPEAHYNLAKVLYLKKQIPQAVQAYRKTLALNPGHSNALLGLGSALLSQGLIDAAVDCFRRAISLSPGNFKAYYNLGYIYHSRNKIDEAIEYYKQALEFNPDHADTISNLGAAYKAVQEYGKAKIWLEKALSLRPDEADSHNSLGTVYLATGETDKAIENFKRAVRLNPNHHIAYNNLGSAFFDLERLNDALECFRNATDLRPDFHEAVFNMARVYHEKNEFDKACTYYRKAIELNPDYITAHWNLSEVLLKQGILGLGWDEYEWGLRFNARGHYRLPIPVWDGVDAHKKTIYIQAEQGLGDEIRYASCFNEVIDFSEQCVIECDHRLAELYKRSFPGAIVHGCRGTTGDNAMDTLPSIDCQISSGSLPRLLRREIDSFPTNTGYLIADKDKTAAFSTRLAALGPGMKVGITWRSKLITRWRKNYYTSIDQWGPILSVPNVQFICLQYDECQDELNLVERLFGIKIHRLGDLDLYMDIDGLASLIDALDLTITPANSVGTLAGALGKPVWKLCIHGGDLTCLGTDYCPWFPSMKLMIQPRPGDWSGAIINTARSLHDLASRFVTEDTAQTVAANR